MSVVACLALMLAPLVGHGGEDHGEAAAVARPVAGDVRRASATTDDLELTLRWAAEGGEPRTIDVLLADAETNAPIPGAAIELRWSGAAALKVQAVATREPGIYVAELDAPAGLYHVTASVSTGTRGDLLLFDAIDLRAASPPEPVDDAHEGQPWLWIGLGIGALLLVAFTSFLAGRMSARRGADAALALWLAVTLPFTLSTSARAHGGDDHDHPAPGAVSSGSGDARFIAKELQFLLGIRTARVTSRPMSERLRVPGRVVAPPDAIATVRVPRSGRIELADSGAFPALGEPVVAGQVLAVLVDLPSGVDQATLAAERARARGTREQALARLSALRSELRRKGELRELTAARELEELQAQVREVEAEVRASQAAATALTAEGATIALRAPIDGVIAGVAEGLAVGGVAGDGDVVFTIIRPARLQIAAYVFEQEVRAVLPDVAALVRGPGFDPTLRATLVTIAPTVDATRRTVELRYTLAGEATLRLNQYVEVDVPVAPPLDIIAVPESALDEVEGRPVIYLKTGAETFAPRAVMVVRREGGWVGVRGDVTVGDRVVVEGGAFIDGASPAARP